MTIAIRCKKITSALLACALGIGVAVVPATSAFAGTNGLTVMSYKYYWMDPGIGVVHWQYCMAYVGFKSRHRIRYKLPDGGYGFKTDSEYRSFGIRSTVGHNLLGGQDESWGDFISS